jgi:hypothetical protein
MVVPEFFNEWFVGRGFMWEICHGDIELRNPWTFYFCMSKIPELLDTVFIVLRKRPLRFLQYYHHIVTMWFCWAAWAQKIECGGMPEISLRCFVLEGFFLSLCLYYISLFISHG